jgi:MOSC domain-containing protein YiiM
MHVDLAALEAGLDEIRRAPTDEGTVELVIRRPTENEREILAEAHLDATNGVVGDRWLVQDGNPDRQVTLMNARAATLIAGSRERWALAGDQLYVDLDLSGGNLPPGSRFAIGTAILEVSREPHRGCKKFAARFGLDALRFVNCATGYALNLRGINARVVQAGVVRPGDAVRPLRVAVEQPAQ